MLNVFTAWKPNKKVQEMHKNSAQNVECMRKKHKRVEILHRSIQKAIVPENINKSNIFNI
jgi:hypothetical protein